MATRTYRASDGDVETLWTLRYRWRTDEGGERGYAPADFAERFRAWCETHRDSHVAHLVSVDDVAVGCAWLLVVDRVPGPERFLRRAGMLQSVYVEPAWRRGGLGSELVTSTLETARSLGLDYVMVHPTETSFPFYHRLGFAPTERVLELRLDLVGGVEQR